MIGASVSSRAARLLEMTLFTPVDKGVCGFSEVVDKSRRHAGIVLASLVDDIPVGMVAQRVPVYGLQATHNPEPIVAWSDIFQGGSRL